MTRYRLRPLVSDWDGEALWVGPLPHGPITRIEGVGALVLDLLADEPDLAPTAAELAARLRGVLNDVPADAETTLAAFLAELDAGGILEGLGEDSP